jgi:hypothetical protein
VRSEKLVAEAGDILGMQRKEAATKQCLLRLYVCCSYSNFWRAQWAVIVICGYKC